MSESSRVSVVSDPQHAAKILRALGSFREESGFCDALLVLEEQEIPVQRNILAAASPYIRAKLNYNPPKDDGSPYRIEMEGISVAIMKEILDYIFSGQIRLSEDTIQDVVQAADLMLLTDLKTLCCEFLEGCITAENCIGIRDFALHYCLNHVHYIATEYLETHFRDVSSTEEFLELNHLKVKEVLSLEKLNVGNEKYVFEAVLRWLSHDLEARKVHMKEVTSALWVTGLDPSYLRERMLTEPLVREIVRECSNIPLSQPQQGEAVLASFKPRGYSECIVTVGGEERASNDIPVAADRNETEVEERAARRAHSFRWMRARRSRTPPFISEECFPCDPQRSPAAQARFEADSVRINNTDWCTCSNCIPLSTKMESVCCQEIAHARNHIPAGASCIVDNIEFQVECLNLNRIDYKFRLLGAKLKRRPADFDYYRSRKPLAAVRCMCPLYDRNRQLWIELAPLSMPRINHGVLSAEGFLFVLGGQNEDSETLSSGEQYDPDANAWSPLPPMIEARHSFGIVEIDGVIYILGGEDGEHELISMESYDTCTKTWSQQKNMTMVRKIGCYAAMKKKIYAMGGGSYGKLFESVECYDPKTQQWTAICPLKERRFGAVACGVGMELYVFGGVRSRENETQNSDMVACKSEFYHDDFKRWIYLNDQNLCIPTSSSFVYGAVAIGASIYVIGDLDTGTNYDYVREFKRSTGTWHHTKPLLPSDLRRTGCAALRIANCRLFRLQLQQGLFRIRLTPS